MIERKTKGRFTIQFNLADPQQASAADTLEQQGRHKAQFLTNAIRSYIGDDRKQGSEAALTGLEERVKELVEQYMAAERSPLRGSDCQGVEVPSAVGAGSSIDYSAVKDTLLAFNAAEA